MAFPFTSFQPAKRNQIVVIDLGSRTTKAIHLQRKGERISLANYTVLDAPEPGTALTPDLFGVHLKTVSEILQARVKALVLVMGPAESLLRQAEMPMAPVADLRLMLKYNSKNYLQQELPDHVFDCQVLPSRGENGAGEGGRKCNVLIGGAKRELLDGLQAAAKSAGMTADQIVPNLASVPNAFELAQPEVFQKEAVALVDIGFKSSTISILLEGELCLNRVVALGGDTITAGIAEALGTGYAEAEGIKVGLPEEVDGVIQSLLMPLGRELRASLDFFEHQHDRTISKVFISGGSARSKRLIEMLQAELMTPCQVWDPLSALILDLPSEKLGQAEQVAPQLAVAIGAGIGGFNELCR